MREDLHALIATFDRLVEGENQTIAFFDHFPEPAWIKAVDRDGQFRMLRINRAYEEQLAVPIARYEGQTDMAVWGPKIAALSNATDEQVVRTGQPVCTDTVALGKRWIGWKWPGRDKAGNVIAVFGWARGE